MTTRKARTFPLPLSSVVDSAPKKGMPSSSRHDRSATPKTATRNATKEARPAKSAASSMGVASKAPVGRLNANLVSASGSGMLVSNVVRRSMVERLMKQGIKDARVLAAMEAAPRHLFLDPALASQAYIDASLPIGHHQTISQPYIVARMIEILRDNRQDGVLNSVLEIGTGCGYQALVLSLVAKEVYSIERIKGLHELAKSRLRPLLVPNIRLHYGDGMLGLPQAAPFDGIILAAAGLEVPQALLDQLAIGGRLVAPVGSSQQSLQLIERVGAAEWKKTVLEDCHFVPLLMGTV